MAGVTLAYSEPSNFGEVAVLPEPGDNCGIARCTIAAGTELRMPSGSAFVLPHQVLEGHRFSIVEVAKDEPLLSWNAPFGFASRDISPGEYICNSRVLVSLRKRRVDFPLPASPNFVDRVEPHAIDETTFVPSEQIPLVPADELRAAAFMGYARAGGRGVGTRNFVAVIGTSSGCGAFARALAERTTAEAQALPNVDGVVAIAHTEGSAKFMHPSGGDSAKPNNFELLLRTLAGFVVHCNVGAALVLDRAGSAHEQVSCADLRAYMAEQGMGPWLAAMPVSFGTLSGDWEGDMASYAGVVRGWLQDDGAAAAAEAPAGAAAGARTLRGAVRTAQPLRHLKLALQCGGSDAFSGVSGNPAAGGCARKLIQHGGVAVLAETDELIGAEAYVTRRSASVDVAKKFVATVERFKRYMSWHGQSAEANPSGGNNYRGIYNISLKSLGAAKKKPIDVRLDGVHEYGQLIDAHPDDGGAAQAPASAETRGRYLFMDSPGNDLESIAGQVATGCNVIFFTTGNGAITNFPFVPTLKLITTTARYNLLSKEMDFNAGQFQDGRAMTQIVDELFAQMCAVGSGQKSKGEVAGHAQVSIWREWPQTAFEQSVEDEHAGQAGAPSAAAKQLDPTAGDGDDRTAQGDLMRRQAAALQERFHRLVLKPVSAALPARRDREPSAPKKQKSGAERQQQQQQQQQQAPRVAKVPPVAALRLTSAGPAAGGGASMLDCVGLILPTSLCSSQIAVLIARSLNERIAGSNAANEFAPIRRFVALPHTEGCGCGSLGSDASIYEDILLGHMTHGSVVGAFMLEHGCEKHHNDLWQSRLAGFGIDTAGFGWASVQLGGGIRPAQAAVQEWFAQRAATIRVEPVTAGLDTLRVGLMAAAPVPPEVGALMAALARAVIDGGGGAIVPEHSTLLQSSVFIDACFDSSDVGPTMHFGGKARACGLHVMSSSTQHWVEVLSGLAAAHCNVVVAYAPDAPVQGHPFVPVVQLAVARRDAHGGASEARVLAHNSSADIVLADFIDACDAEHASPDPSIQSVLDCGWFNDACRGIVSIRPETFAARELATFCSLSIVAPAAAGARAQLAVGFGAASALGLAEIAAELAELGDEGFLVANNFTSGARNVVLSGGRNATRGTLYAAYHAATELLGMRFYAPDETRAPTVALPLAPASLARAGAFHYRLQKPTLEYRSLNGYQGTAPTGTAWAVRNHENQGTFDAAHGGTRTYASPPGFVHTSYALVSGTFTGSDTPPVAMFLTHPEWFWPHNDSSARGQLCWTNPELVAFLKTQVRAALEAVTKRGDPLPDIISVSQNDNQNYCKDEAELAVIRAEGSPIGPLLRAVNAIADDIVNDYPAVAVDTLAYQYTRPAPKLTKPRRNVIVRLCSIECNFAKPLTDASNQPFLNDITNWARISNRTYIWDYVTNFGNYLAPFPNYYVLAANIAFFAQHGVRGVFEEGAYQGPSGELRELKDYVMLSALWDPAAAGADGGRAAIDEFLPAYYGDAGGAAVRAYMDTFHDSAINTSYYMHENFPVDAAFLTPAALLRAASALAGAKGQAGEEKYAARLDRVLLGVAYVILLRWDEVHAYAQAHAAVWPLEPTKQAALGEFARIYNATGITHLSESGHDLAWFESQVMA
eukprot:g3620.t1